MNDTRRLDAIEAVNNLLDMARLSGGDGTIWAVVVNKPDDGGAAVVALFGKEDLARSTRDGLGPFFALHSPDGKDPLLVIQLDNVPLAFGATLPGGIGGVVTKVPIPIAFPTTPAARRRFTGKRR